MKPCNFWYAMVVVLLAMALAGCAGQQRGMATSKTETVEVTFNDLGCPTSVDPNLVTVNKSNGDKVRWQSVDSAGNETGVSYEIFFDPFKGNPIRSNPQGRTPVMVIDSDTPAGVQYKYTVYVATAGCQPYDPRIMIL